MGLTEDGGAQLALRLRGMGPVLVLLRRSFSSPNSEFFALLLDMCDAALSQPHLGDI